VLTADTYTTVLPAAPHKAAEATARLILTSARNARTKIPEGPPTRKAVTRQGRAARTPTHVHHTHRC
jgi:hypothetical protein